MIPKREPGDEWLWVGWFSTNWHSNEDERDELRTRPNCVVDLPRLIVLVDGVSGRGPRFYIHKDLIDE